MEDSILNVLILNEKFCDYSPSMGLSNSFHNVLNTYIKSRDDNKVHIIHHDEALLLYGKTPDDYLLDYCSKYSINVVIITLLGKSPSNPSNELLRKLKESGVYLAFQWPDSGLDPNENIIRLWTPEDTSFFHPAENQDIKYSFVGSTNNYKDREHFLGYIVKAFPDFLIAGGQRQQALGPDAYASVIRRSKISLNFSISISRFFQLKGRVFESLFSRSLLVEFRNPSTRELFTPDVDYIEFDTAPELIEKIRYYSENEEERKKIAENGHQKCVNHYSSKHYWNAIFDRINKDLNHV